MKWFSKYLQKLKTKRKKFTKELETMIIDKFPPIIDESMEIREKSLDEENK